MNGASASAGVGTGAGAGGEAPLVYKAWKGNNVSGMPLSPLSSPLRLSSSPSSFVAGVVWICAALMSRVKLTVPFFLGIGTRLTRVCGVVGRCWDSLAELGKFVWSLLAPKIIDYSIFPHLFYDFVLGFWECRF